MAHDSALTTLDGVIETLYQAISGPAGPRNAMADAVLFHPTARLTRTFLDDAGQPRARVMTHAEYVADTASFFAANDFWEREVGRLTHRLESMAHVLSVYEARTRPGDPDPERRGINSIQLFHDGERWWIMNLLWANESAASRIPLEWYSATDA
jgi:hypothetical protein